ncbi:polyunsaturated fatty acid lipoxygenase ALOX15B isoform X2 [Hemibagrus wyckioides]|nr:polyunsaturated fatty acid lipoxygenase ALOX15B isoform X2 [Hemibagrus wyckioides]
MLREHRARDLQKKQKQIKWRTFAEGAPHCIDMSSAQALGPNLIFTRQSPGTNVHYLKGFHDRIEPWSSMKELETLFNLSGKDNTVAKYVHAHWKEDAFFGYQCLNGCNPLMIRRIRCLPPNLAVTSQMLRDFLPEGSSLEQELEKGTIFLLDYEILDQLPANVINGKKSYLAAPLCLLHYNHHGEMKPVAIQLQKNAGPQNPVFLPSDSTPDWLLAKIWVRNADFQVHQLLSHFLRTHLVGEVCCIATLRKLPEIHPLHQLLMPHLKNSLQINIQARASLLGPDGVFDKAIGCGLEVLPLLLARGTDRLHYTSLCVPDDLKERGLDKLPNCYYAQDALRVWNALHRFISAWVELYYHDDQELHHDSELQSWIQEIHIEGFLGFTHTGFPQTFQTKAELSKYITMVIFTSSSLHAAVNFSQVDFNLWMPNCPSAMLRPPPQVKGLVTEEDILTFLPDVNTTCRVLSVLFLLSQPSLDYVPLCQYTEWYFSSGAPHKLVEMVQKDLRDIAHEILKRNSKLELAYLYLHPDNIENSVAI